MTVPDPTPTPTPDEDLDPKESVAKARKMMVAAVPDAIKALKDLAANATEPTVRLQAAQLLLDYGVPVTRGGVRGDLL